MNDSTQPSVGSATAKFTAEPWQVVPPDRDNPSRAMVSGHNHQVTIYDAPLTCETEANARLIAAAPELLSLLKSAHAFIFNSRVIGSTVFASEIMDAIRRAEGGAA